MDAMDVDIEADMDISDDEDTGVVGGLDQDGPEGVRPTESAPLPTDKKEALKLKIAADKYDADAWTQLVMEIQTAVIDIARPVYEEFLSIFPTAGRYWKYYAEHELQAGNYENAEKVFMRCLPSCPNIDLWKSYIKYMLEYKAKIPGQKDFVLKAFDFAVAHVGMDISATSLWTDYINFVKHDRVSTQLEESQKMDLLRKLYQRAIEIPMHNVESLWREYDQFENGLNKQLAKALLSEHAPRYMAARSTFRERKNYIEGLSKNALARPPRGHTKEMHQVRLWKRLIDYEKKNPQRLDPQGLNERVTFTYNQCLMCLYHYPEIWHQLARFQLDNGDAELGEKTYKRALQAQPSSLLLHFQYCDFLELRGQIDEATQIYSQLLEKFPEPLVFVQHLRFARRTEGVQGARKAFFKARKSPHCTYHVYVAAAMIEYYMNKDEQVARNVLELGSKKFGNDMAFVMQYIDFLFHRNEENDMRVLFEKVLTTLPRDQASEIWNMFLKFETLTGSLETVTRVQKRRTQAYPDMDPSGIFGVVQQYRFLDLWPCNQAELTSFTLDSRRDEDTNKPAAEEPQTGRRGSRGRKGSAASGADAAQKSGITMPDLKQLVLYKPDESGMMMAGPAGGGIGAVSIAPVLNAFMSKCPLPHLWDGPLVDVERLMQSIRDAAYELHNAYPQTPTGSSTAVKDDGKKKKRKGGDDSDGEDEDGERGGAGVKRGGSADIYKQRMMKRMKSQSNQGQ